MIKSMFDCFNILNEKLDNNISEISVKQSQISITFEDPSIVIFKDIMTLNSFENQYSVTTISTLNDNLYVVFSNLDETLINIATIEPYSFLYGFIFDLKEVLCSCPALEYVISANYIKVYLDLPNLYARDISKVDEKLKSEGVLELSTQRPYLLYVKDW